MRGDRNGNNPSGTTDDADKLPAEDGAPPGQMHDGRDLVGYTGMSKQQASQHPEGAELRADDYTSMGMGGGSASAALR